MKQRDNQMGRKIEAKLFNLYNHWIQPSNQKSSSFAVKSFSIHGLLSLWVCHWIVRPPSMVGLLFFYIYHARFFHLNTPHTGSLSLSLPKAEHNRQMNWFKELRCHIFKWQLHNIASLPKKLAKLCKRIFWIRRAFSCGNVIGGSLE